MCSLPLMIAVVAAGGCAKSAIELQLYGRTPELDAQWKPSIPPNQLWVGVAADGEESRTCAEQMLSHGDGGRFAYFGWAQGENLQRLDCQVECLLEFEYSRNKKTQYCLGRLFANIYNADHSALLDRKVFFHEAMYTAGRKPIVTHDGKSSAGLVSDALFDQLLNYLAGEAPHRDYPVAAQLHGGSGGS